MKHIITLFFLIVSSLMCSYSSAQSKSDKIVARNLASIEKRLDEMLVDQVDAIYMRAFKYDAQLEVWIQANNKWSLFKTYDICAISGTLGPKRIQGDRQVPEGCYSIIEYNPNSSYHLSMKLNYPNESDYYFSDSSRPGDMIFIHGGCATIGCIPLTDSKIEEVWTLTTLAKNKIINVHIFSIKFDKQTNWNALQTTIYSQKDLDFQESMKKIYFYFQDKKKLPIVTIGSSGNYIIISD